MTGTSGFILNPCLSMAYSPGDRNHEPLAMAEYGPFTVANVIQMAGDRSKMLAYALGFVRIFKDITSLSPLKYRQTYKVELD